jgi:hypothetical protein
LDGLVHVAFTSAKPRPGLPETQSSSIELPFTSSLTVKETVPKAESAIAFDEEEIVSRFFYQSIPAGGKENRNDGCQMC